MATKKAAAEEAKTEITNPAVDAIEKVPETVEPLKVEEVILSVQPEVEKPKEVISVEVVIEKKDNRSFEERILSFVEDKSGDVKLNDFLKSLYGVPKPNVQAEWQTIGASKGLKSILSSLVDSGKLSIHNNAHLQLGKPYHEGE